MDAGQVDPETLAPHYVIEQFGTADGLPKAGISQVAKTPDGYMWIATFGGLVRFDGHDFKVLDLEQIPALGGSRMAHLFVDAQGRLWVLAESGRLSVRVDGSFRSCGATAGDGFTRCQGTGPGPPAFKYFLPQPDGTLWISSMENGLYRAKDDGLINESSFADAEFVYRITADNHGKLWVQVGDQLFFQSSSEPLRFDRLKMIQHPELDSRALINFGAATDNEGTVWINTGTAFGRLSIDPETKKEVFEKVLPRSAGGGPWVSPSPSGHLWIADMQRLMIYRNGSLETLAENTKPAFAIPSVFYQSGRDQQGRTWLIWRNLLIREDDGLTLPVSETDDFLTSLWLEETGVIWTTSFRGSLFGLYPSQVETFKRGLANANIYTVSEDTDGSYWVGGGPPSVLPPGKEEFEVLPCPGVDTICDARNVYRDEQDRGWMIGIGEGLWQLTDNGSYEGPFLPTNDELPSLKEDFPLSIRAV